MNKKALVALLALAMLFLQAPLVWAAPTVDPPVSCPPGSQPNPITGVCTIVVGDPGGPGGGGGGGGTGGGGTGGGQPVIAPVCTWAGREIPCTKGDQGSWNADNLCYVSPDPGTHGADDPIWGGHYPDGAIFLCYNPFIPGGAPYPFWAAAAPAGAPPPPDPLVLARQAIATMNLQAVTIGIVPEAVPGRVGLIGLPTWMWAQAPAPNTMGPITKSASAGGYTVVAVAKVDRVVWNMGDGESVMCAGPGTPYADSYGKSSSPTCGHTYTRQGGYTVSATSYWTVTWNGIGQTGAIPLNFSRSAAITMGEAQVLNR